GGWHWSGTSFPSSSWCCSPARCGPPDIWSGWRQSELPGQQLVGPAPCGGIVRPGQDDDLVETELRGEVADALADGGRSAHECRLPHLCDARFLLRREREGEWGIGIVNRQENAAVPGDACLGARGEKALRVVFGFGRERPDADVG